MYSGKLTKLETKNDDVSENPVRSKFVDGDFEKLPTVGESFSIYGAPINKDMDYRRLTTSIVQKVTETDDGLSMVIETLNSTYLLQIVGMDNDQTSHYNA